MGNCISEDNENKKDIFHDIENIDNQIVVKNENQVQNLMDNIGNDYAVDYVDGFNNDNNNNNKNDVEIIGNTKDGLPEGECKVTHRDGTIYKGNFVNGKLEGKNGYFKNRDLFVYNGEFRNGVFNGYGEVKWTNGDSYKGNFLNGLFHGEGRYTFKDGKVFVGNYKNGKKDGDGTIHLNNKDNVSYTGKWSNGKLVSVGVFKKGNTTVSQGKWNNGTFVDINKKK